ncbi:MAG: FHA domain-containing protein [Planctomycetota bacterium]
MALRIVIVHLSGHDAGRRDVFPFRTLVIGRDSDCDVRFEQTRDLEVSGHHAEIRTGDDRTLTVADLGSTNGTWLNGKEVTDERPLASGDIVELGPGGPRLRVTILRGVIGGLVGLIFGRHGR